MVEHEGDGAGIEPGVECIQHGASHRHAKVGLDHFRRVRQHRRNRIANADAVFCQRGGKPATARIRFLPRIAPPAMDNRCSLRIDLSGPGDKSQRA